MSAITAFEIDAEGRADSAMNGGIVMLAARVLDVGSRITDVDIGGMRLQIPNRHLAASDSLHADLCDTEGG